MEGTSGGNSTIYWLFGSAMVLVGAGFIYYKYGKAPSPSADGTSDKGGGGSAAADKASPKAPSGTTDYTNLPNGKSLFPKMPDTAHGLNLGQDVTVKAGAVVTRLDQALAPKGTTTLTADTALGKIWKHDVGATIRAKDSFSYPFYRVEYKDINQKGSVIDKGIGEAKAAVAGTYDWLKSKFSDDGYVSADGFGKE